RDRHGNVTQMDTARIGRRTAEPEPDLPAPDSAPVPDAPKQQLSNVIQLGNRLNVIPPPEAIERGLIAEEAAADIQQIKDCDVKRLDHRVTAVNYALAALARVEAGEASVYSASNWLSALRRRQRARRGSVVSAGVASSLPDRAADRRHRSGARGGRTSAGSRSGSGGVELVPCSWSQGQ
ncbi:hypothetical protein, partial [Bradyrhizobium sp. P5_C11_2]